MHDRSFIQLFRSVILTYILGAICPPPGPFVGPALKQYWPQPRSQGLRGETVTKTLVKFVLSFQNFGKTIACAVRHNRIQLCCNSMIAIRLCRTAHAIFSPKFWNVKMNFTRVFVTVSPRRPWDRGCIGPLLSGPFCVVVVV